MGRCRLQRWWKYLHTFSRAEYPLTALEGNVRRPRISKPHVFQFELGGNNLRCLPLNLAAIVPKWANCFHRVVIRERGTMVWENKTGWRVGVLFLATVWILGAGILLHPVEVMAQKTERVAAASPAGTAAADSLARIIEEAKREGVVDVALQSSLTPRGVAAVQEGIRKKYGVDLKINYSPTRSYPEIAAKALTEHKARAVPSYDLITGGEHQIFVLTEDGAVEHVAWGSLLPPGTPPEVVLYGGGGLVVNTAFLGLLYNPKVIRPEEAPATLKDLTNPKWRGKVLIPPFTSTWMTQALPMGRQASLSLVDGILKIWQEIATNPNFYYRGKSPFELGAEWQGVSPWLWTLDRLRYMSTPEGQAWEQEIG